MRAHWRKIAYVAFWVLLLAVTLESFVHPEADNETRAVLYFIAALFAAPISFVLLLAFYAINLLSPNAGATISVIVFGGSSLQFLLWWLLMLAISYWQWFHLFSKAARWVKARYERASPPETPEE